MSTDNSASTKWIVGCLIAGIVGIFLCGGAIVLLSVWAYRTASQVAQQIGPEFQQQMQDMQFASAWPPPPPDAGPDVLLPEQISGWLRASHDETAAIPELAIARDGLHGVYESGGVTVDVYACPLSPEEQRSQFAESIKAIEGAGYTTHSQANVDMGSYHWLTFSFNPPQRFGRMWWSQGWLIVTMTGNESVDLKSFERDYLVAVSQSELPVPADTPSEIEPQTEPAEPLPADPSAGEAAPEEPELDSAPASESPRG